MEEQQLLKDRLKWLCTRSKAARSKGLAIDCTYINPKTKELKFDNRPLLYGLMYDDLNDEFYVRCYLVSSEKDPAFGGMHFGRPKRVSYVTPEGPLVFPDGTVSENDMRANGIKNKFIYHRWSLKPSVLTSLLKNPRLSAHERMQLEMAFDVIKRLIKAPEQCKT